MTQLAPTLDLEQESSAEELAGDASANPFFLPWTTPYGTPPFARIRDHHFRPAFERGIEEMRARIAAIRTNPEPPTFENTVKALELAHPLLARTMEVFRNIVGTDVDPTLQAIQSEIVPRLTRENDAILHDEELFRRIEKIYGERDRLGLDVEDARLLELTYEDFTRAGAALEPAAKAHLKELNARLAELTTRFTQNLLAETKSFELVVEDEADLAGLPADLVEAARRAARVKGRPRAWIFGLDRSSFEAFMTWSKRRELRRHLFDGYRHRGANGGDTDNRELIREIVRLRAERAVLLGHESHAHYQLAPTMTKTPQRARELLLEFWKCGLERAREELGEMQAIARHDGVDPIAGWDWWYYAEKLREEKYDFDESQVEPYFELENVRAGAFHVAHKLFGITFEPLEGVPTWHPRVLAYRVREADGSFLGLFMVDDYTRDSKKFGAWMNTYRDASNIDGEDVRPIVINVMNLIEPSEGGRALLKFDEVETVFHEFGHALHGLLTRARYQRFSGTSGSPRDFVEFPSQFMEHYAIEPEVLAVYARHYETGEVIPGELVEKLRKARTHNQGFKVTEYVAAALVDLAWHTLSPEEAAAVDDVRAFERQVLENHGLLEEIEPRYRSPYFSHIFSSPSGYSAGYYAYLWSETLDADGFAAFEQAGDIFDPDLAERLAEHVFRAGFVAPGDVLYRRFRGADPKVEPLLKIRGFAPA